MSRKRMPVSLTLSSFSSPTCRVRGVGFSDRPIFQRGRLGCGGSGCRVQGSGCRVQGAGCRVQGSGCRVQGAGCRVQGAGSTSSKAAKLSALSTSAHL